MRPFLRELLVMLASIIAPATMILGAMFSNTGIVLQVGVPMLLHVPLPGSVPLEEV